MSKKNNKKKGSNIPPYGVIAGLVTASFATLIGVWNGLDPFAVLIRAAISGSAMGMVVSFGIGVIAAANVKQQSDH